MCRTRYRRILLSARRLALPGQGRAACWRGQRGGGWAASPLQVQIRGSRNHRGLAKSTSCVPAVCLFGGGGDVGPQVRQLLQGSCELELVTQERTLSLTLCFDDMVAHAWYAWYIKRIDLAS